MTAAFPLPNRRWLTVHEAAAICRVSPMSMYRLIRAGELPAVRIGRIYRIDAERFDTWLRNSRVEVKW